MTEEMRHTMLPEGAREMKRRTDGTPYEVRVMGTLRTGGTETKEEIRRGTRVCTIILLQLLGSAPAFWLFKVVVFWPVVQGQVLTSFNRRARHIIGLIMVSTGSSFFVRYSS